MTSSSPPPYSNSNGRVSNAILSTKMDNVIEELRKLRETTDRRLWAIEEKADIQIDALKSRCQDNETKLARLEERQKATTGVLGVATVVLSGIATAIGSLVK